MKREVVLAMEEVQVELCVHRQGSAVCWVRQEHQTCRGAVAL